MLCCARCTFPLCSYSLTSCRRWQKFIVCENVLTSLKSSLRRLPSWIYICVSLIVCLVKLSCVACFMLARVSHSFSLSLDSPWLNIAKWFSHSRRIAAALLESIRPADLWPSLMYVYPFLLTLHCAKTPTRSWYPGKCSNLLPTPPFPSLATLFCQLLARL